MYLLPRSRRGTWLLAGAAWCAACAGLWCGLPVAPDRTIRIDGPLRIIGFSPAFGAAIVKRSNNDGQFIHEAIELLDLVTGKSFLNVSPNAADATLLGASADGRVWIFAESKGSNARFLKVDLSQRTVSRTPVPIRSNNNWLDMCRVSPDALLVAFFDEKENSLVLWDTERNDIRGRLPNLFPPYVFSVDGSALAACRSAKEIVILGVPSLVQQAALNIPLGCNIYDSPALAGGGRYVAGLAEYEGGAAPFDRYLVCWEVASGAEIIREKLADVAGSGAQREIRFSGASRMLLLVPNEPASDDFRCFDMQTRKRLIGLDGVDVGGRQLSPNGRVLAASAYRADSALLRWTRRLGLSWLAGSDWSVLLYDLTTGKRLGPELATGRLGLAINNGFDTVYPVWSADSTAIATENARDASIIDIWDIPPRRPLTWFATGAALLALPIAFFARRRVRKLRAA
jgi:hypothetical protein